MPEGYDINWMAVLLVAAVGFAAMAALFAVSYILAPRRPSEAKDIPYECGIPHQRRSCGRRSRSGTTFSRSCS